jgi:hypothetical protein
VSSLVFLVLLVTSESEVQVCKVAVGYRSSPTFKVGSRQPILKQREACAGVGVVKETGPNAMKFKIGQRVVSTDWGASEGNGTWQQYCAVPESDLVMPWLLTLMQVPWQ